MARRNPRPHTESVSGRTGSDVTAVAHPNIALIKYWGKRDESWILPAADSLSMTLDIFPTTTTVRPTTSLDADAVSLDGRPAPAPMTARIAEFLDLVRALAGSHTHAMVDTRNTVPAGAGLASSAAGFAALATAAAHAYGLPPDRREVSRLARRGSGSACRSIFGGFVWWHAGPGSGPDADRDCYSEPIDATGLDPAMVVTVVDNSPKSVPSRDAMAHTAATSPLYRAWVASCAGDLDQMRTAIAAGDLKTVGQIAEYNALAMHATLLAARPPIRYPHPLTWMILDRVAAIRSDGIPAYATIDAGPNVVALCHRGDADQVAAAIAALDEHITTHITLPGPAAALVNRGGR
ncbi:diphosphomevalonate decarboxylase [Nocardia terpenica]